MALWLAAAILAAAVVPAGAAAQEPNRAALAVQFGEGQVETRCLAFEGDEISGADLLARSGLEMVIDASTGMGITVCRIEGVGCNYPAEHCFCRCMGGGACAYWNYYFRDPGQGEWIYSALGAVVRKARPGSVEAWVWGDHSPPSEALTFEAICQPATPTPAPTEAAPTRAVPTGAPTLPPATVTAAAVETISPTRPPAGATAATDPTPDPMPSPTPAAAPGADLAGYWPFGLMLLVLAAVGLVVWLRRS